MQTTESHIERVGEVVEYFMGRKADGDNPMPLTPILLKPYLKIHDVYKMVRASMNCVHEHKDDLGNYLPYLEQLEELIEHLTLNEL